jgi:hypothetical protein
MVNKTWHLVEQHGCWWAYEGELPPAGGIHDAQPPGHLANTWPLSLARDGRGAIAAPSVWSQVRSPGEPLSSTSARMAILRSPLILKRASASRPSCEWDDDDYDVLENGVVLGRIFCVDAVGPQGRPWMWVSGDGRIKRAAHGYAVTREEAMGSVR